MNTMHTAFSIALTVALTTGLAACNRDSRPKTGDASPSLSGMTGSKAGSGENMASDAAITAKIKIALLEARDVKSTDISVDTNNGGRVTLTGTVPDASQVDRAAKVASGVDGVRTVDNKLGVKSSS